MLALVLGILTLAGVVRLRHVFAFAFLSGSAAALDPGLLIAKVDIGWGFPLNGLSFAAAALLDVFLPSRGTALKRQSASHDVTISGGASLCAKETGLRAILIMLFLIGTFGLNFPIFISTMAVSVFHSDARGFGLLSSILAAGTRSGAGAGFSALVAFYVLARQKTAALAR